jgi:hypothetical protein
MDALILLDKAREAGLAVTRDGGKLVVRGPRGAEPVVRLLAEHKADILAALAEATSWSARHREALAHWSAFRPIDEARRIAWGELEDRWHRLHSARKPEWQCAGCGEPIGGRAAPRLADGCHVHPANSCLLAYGERWRAEARAALTALGLDPPLEKEP